VLQVRRFAAVSNRHRIHLSKQLATHTSGIIDNDSIYHKSYKFIITVSINKDALSAMKESGYSGGLTDTTLETFLQSY
jgi:hypothetical protein